MKVVGAIISVALVAFIIGITNWPSWADALFVFIVIGVVIAIVFRSASSDF